MDKKQKKFIIAVSIVVLAFVLLMIIGGAFVSWVAEETRSSVKAIAYWSTILFGLTAALTGLLFWKIQKQEVLLTHLMKKTIYLNEKNENKEVNEKEDKDNE